MIGFIVFVLLISWMLIGLKEAYVRSISKKTPIEEMVSNSYRNSPVNFSGASKWHAKGEIVEVNGYTLPGLVYTGKASKGSGINSQGIDNHIIDVDLKVDDKGKASLERMGYWPSYSTITPKHRAKYLKFLSEGANDLNTELGNVFLYFYGLETRLMKDESMSEYEDIISEVSRLRALYLSVSNPSRSFDLYSQNLLSSAFILKHRDGKISEISDYNSLYLHNKSVLDIYISERTELGQTIPAEIIINGIRATYYSGRISFTRAKEEFDKLFIRLFNEKYPKGFKPAKRKKKLVPEYRACSGNFTKTIYRELPLIVTESFYNQFDRLIDQCCDKLDDYSRYLGKTDLSASLYSNILLPQELLMNNASVANYINDTKDTLNDENIKVISFQKFSAQFKSDGKLTKKEYENVASFHNEVGLAIVPNPLYGDNFPKLNENIILFELPSRRALNVSSEFQSVKNVLDLSVAVAMVDDIHVSEIEVIHKLIDSYKNLNIDEGVLLKKRIVYLERNPSLLKDIKSRVADLEDSQKRSLIDLLISIILADQKISKEETKILRSIYIYFGYDEKRMYGDLHNIQIDLVDEPVLVESGEREENFIIPKVLKRREKIPSIDMAIVHRKMEETKKVVDVLSAIFKEDQQPILVSANACSGLDGNVAEFFTVLMTRNAWTRESLEKEAKDRQIFLGSALEKINDWSLAQFEETIVDDDGDTLTVNRELIS